MRAYVLCVPEVLGGRLEPFGVGSEGGKLSAGLCFSAVASHGCLTKDSDERVLCTHMALN